MKTMSKVGSTTALALTLLSANVSAEEQYPLPDGYNDIYFGLTSTFVTVDFKGSYYDASEDDTLSGKKDIHGNTLLGVLVGYQFNPWMAVEGRGYRSVANGKWYGFPIDVTEYYGVFGRAILPVCKYFSTYGLVGYGTGTMEGFGASDTENDLAYGLGVEFNKGGRTRLQVEWVMYHDEKYTVNYSNGDIATLDAELSSINANLVWSF
ncbi:porin family protein [Vibrio sp. JC009]|uniref:outer membrane beta-barrel protein n=1 Tax=Vibrio sp. JC009 TaxID=2912314 RepID=UPI0023AED379|nr:outer membrane beta-barrel protein [Vibrio sp. JC009]WED20936.1 porin family protein [Vibrio sp. JC009]